MQIIRPDVHPEPLVIPAIQIKQTLKPPGRYSNFEWLSRPKDSKLLLTSTAKAQQLIGCESLLDKNFQDGLSMPHDRT